MKQERPSVRLSLPMQDLVVQAGGSSAAIRALLILGAAAAGLDVEAAQREAYQLAGHPQVDRAVQHALRGLSDIRQTDVRHVSDTSRSRPAPLPAAEQDEENVFDIGFEV